MDTTKLQDTTCKQIVIPAGIPITGEENIDIIDLKFDITFLSEGHDTPMPPLVQAGVRRSDLNSEMVISMVILVSQKLELTTKDLSIIQDFSYTNVGTPYANFYICYNKEPEPSNTYHLFQLNFKANPDAYTPNCNFPDKPAPDLFALKEITAFLWNEDPHGSRGTVTTVRPSV